MGKLLAALPRLHSTSGGSSDTELKELAVRPRKLPSASRVVMMVTPVANCDSAWRKCAESKPRAAARGKRVFIGALSISAIMPLARGCLLANTMLRMHKAFAFGLH